MGSKERSQAEAPSRVVRNTTVTPERPRRTQRDRAPALVTGERASAARSSPLSAPRVRRGPASARPPGRPAPATSAARGPGVAIPGSTARWRQPLAFRVSRPGRGQAERGRARSRARSFVRATPGTWNARGRVPASPAGLLGGGRGPGRAPELPGTRVGARCRIGSPTGGTSRGRPSPKPHTRRQPPGERAARAACASCLGVQSEPAKGREGSAAESTR